MIIKNKNLGIVILSTISGFVFATNPNIEVTENFAPVFGDSIFESANQLIQTENGQYTYKYKALTVDKQFAEVPVIRAFDLPDPGREICIQYAMPEGNFVTGDAILHSCLKNNNGKYAMQTDIFQANNFKLLSVHPTFESISAESAVLEVVVKYPPLQSVIHPLVVDDTTIIANYQPLQDGWVAFRYTLSKKDGQNACPDIEVPIDLKPENEVSYNRCGYFFTTTTKYNKETDELDINTKINNPAQ